MKNIYLPVLTFLIVSCAHDLKNSNPGNPWSQIDSIRITHQLARMVERDQAIMMAHSADETAQTRDSLYREQDRILKNNTDTLQSLFADYGFLGFDKVGEIGSYNYWLLVQHADHEPTFQEAVLTEMGIAVENNNAGGTEYAYLTDRVRSNKGQKQLYGTQVNYIEDFWIEPKPVEDSMNLDKRRKDVGLEKMEKYLNSMMELHYNMNKPIYEKNGLSGPRKYELDQS